MGLCTAFFIVGVVTGLHGMSTMLLEGTGGLFLGVTMKYRFRHVPLILLGTTGGALAVYFMLFFFALLTGQPFDIFILSLHRTYTALMALASWIATMWDSAYGGSRAFSQLFRHLRRWASRTGGQRCTWVAGYYYVPPSRPFTPLPISLRVSLAMMCVPSSVGGEVV
jgi:hypothetical protein